MAPRNPHAPLTPQTAGSGLDRSNSTFRKDLLRLVGHPAKANTPACSTTATPSSMQSSRLSTRSFLMKTGNMRSFHRRDKSVRSATSMQTPAPAAPVAAALMEDLHPIELTADPNVTSHGSSTTSYSSENLGEESAADGPRKESEPFRGLPDYRADTGSHQDLIDHDFLQQAFGITMEKSHSAEQLRPKPASTHAGHPMTPPESDDEELHELEVPTQLAKDRRPELQVSIPPVMILASTSQSANPTPSKIPTIDPACLGTPSTISPPSACTTTRSKKPFNSLATARLSIVSPLSVVEMPKPRRPFSTLSLEGMTVAVVPEATALATKSATSNSSDDISGEDGKSSQYCHSPQSSITSVESDTVLSKSAENPGLRVPDAGPSPNHAGAIDGTILAPRMPANMRSTAALGSSPIKSVKPQLSNSSLRSTFSTINKNKPLPPEPGQVLRPLQFAGPSPSRSSTMTMRQRGTPGQGSQNSGDAQISALSVSRRPSKASTLLKSKYTPKDLDALDDAFQRNDPSQSQVSLPYSNSSTPTLSQVTLALEHQLDTIKEDSPNQSVILAAMSDPLQISRGPMRMEPSRRAPQPPIRPASPPQEKHEGRRRMMKRSASSNHVITQMKTGEPHGHRRASTAVAGSSSKANRILGKSGPMTPPRMQRNGSLDSIWSEAASPENYTSTTSPAMSADETPPESEQNNVPDAHFEEIRKRLELLSPKDDPSQTFLAFHQSNASRSTEKLLLLKQKGREAIKESLKATTRKKSITVPIHIAELEGHRAPSPVELEATERFLPAELAAGSSPQPEQVIAPSETDVHPLERRGRMNGLSPESSVPSVTGRSLHSQRSVKCRSLASLAMSEIPDLYAAIPSAEPRIRPSMTPEEVEFLISADAAERVLLRILQSLENLKDLFAAAEVSRGFYRTFKRHELSLIKGALWSMSPAAWELREMSIPYVELEPGATDYKPSIYLRHYTRDLLTMVELKGMILDHCKSFLRVDTISGLAGETARSPFIDDAFWRVWTFCKIFGCGKGREDDIVGQMDWLRGGVLAKQQNTDTNTLAFNDGIAMNSVLFNPPKGFAKGNGNGLTAEELYDMSEIWTCLGVLIRGYHGKRDDAREYGIFSRANIAPGDVDRENSAIEEWTFYLLTLAPTTILEVTSPTSPTRETFANARSQGYTQWIPPTHGSSRSTFLKEAVSRLYEEKMALRRPSPTLSSNQNFSTLPQVASPPQSSPGSPDATLAARQRCAAHAKEIRAKRQDPTYKDVPVSEERPMSNFPDVLARLDALSTSATTAPPVPKLPSLASRLSFRKNKDILKSPLKTKLKGTPLSPSATAPTASPTRSKKSGRTNESVESLAVSISSRDKLPVHPNAQPVTVPSGPQVRDPVDVAVERLTSMGFEENKAKKALAETDSGNSVDFERAVSMLVKERERKKVMNRLNRMG